MLVEKVALLLNQIIEDNPILSQLYTTGIFFFILMYTGSNVLPIARFLKYSHMKQAFRSDIEVCTVLFFEILFYVFLFVLEIQSTLVNPTLVYPTPLNSDISFVGTDFLH